MPRLPLHRPRVDPDWRHILRHAWSVRLIAAAAILSFADVVLPLIGSRLPFPPLVTALLIGLASGGAFVARLLAQKQFSGESR